MDATTAAAAANGADHSLGSWFATSLSLLAGVLVWRLYQVNFVTFAYWRKLGLDGPSPLFLLGNMHSLLFRDRAKVLLEWRQRYGQFFGIYQGNKPRLYVSDPEVLRQITIKDFHLFQNHESIDYLNSYQKYFIFFSQDDHWKRVRALMSPTFTSGKIKRMYKMLDVCADDLVLCFHQKLAQLHQQRPKDSVVNIKEIYHLYTMDGVSTCCYGIKLERNGATDMKSAASRSFMVASASAIFENSIPRLMAAFGLPKTLLKAVGFEMLPANKMENLASMARNMVETRRKSTRRLDDYLQMLIDAKLDDNLDLGEMDVQENHHASLTSDSLLEDQRKLIEQVKQLDQGSNGDSKISNLEEPNKTSLSDNEILSSAIFLLAVGLETTGTLLAHSTYALAFHQEVQQKLYEEIKKIAELDESKNKYSFSYEAITSNAYLDAVICETLRLMSPVLHMDRVCQGDYTISKYNLTIPKGTVVWLGLYSVQTDPKYWPEPLKFDPDRFLPANRDKIVPGSYCPFGLGPRHCIGMRFSLTEAKIALAKTVMNFKFDPAPNTSFDAGTKLSVGLNNIKTPFVSLKTRDQ